MSKADSILETVGGSSRFQKTRVRRNVFSMAYKWPTGCIRGTGFFLEDSRFGALPRLGFCHPLPVHLTAAGFLFSSGKLVLLTT